MCGVGFDFAGPSRQPLRGFLRMTVVFEIISVIPGSSRRDARNERKKALGDRLKRISGQALRRHGAVPKGAGSEMQLVSPCGYGAAERRASGGRRGGLAPPLRGPFWRPPEGAGAPASPRGRPPPWRHGVLAVGLSPRRLGLSPTAPQAGKGSVRS